MNQNYTMSAKCLRLTTYVLAIIIAFLPFGSIFSASAAAEETAETLLTIDATDGMAEEPDYLVYAEQHTEFSGGDQAIVLAGDSYTQDVGANVTTEEANGGAMRWESESGSLRFRFFVPADGLYTFSLCYRPLPGRGGDLRLGVQLDGKYPFSQARELSFPRLWQDSGDLQTDKHGNEFIPEQIEVDRYVQHTAQDIAGRHNGAYVFFLTAGEHELELVAVSEPFALKSVAFEPVKELPSYADTEKPAAENYRGDPIIMEGEDASYKTASSLLAQSDTDSAVIRPADPEHVVLNYIGGTGWDTIGQAITWKIDVPQDGYYRLGATYRQDTVVNGVSYRLLQVDGSTPFAEAGEWAFSYNNGWDYTDFADENGEPYLLYLTEGPHELSLSVCMGSMAPFRAELETLVDDIGDLYIQIHMITGEFPDANRSYELFKQIPDFNERLEDMATRLNTLADSMGKATGERGGSLIASLNNMRRVINIMLENPYAAHQYKSDYYSNYSTVSSWLYEMTSMPLAIDALYLQSPETEGAARKTGFLQSVWYTCRRFFNSFTQDYRYQSSEENGEALTLWLSGSFDQVQVVQSLLRDSFVEQENIDVEVKLVNTTLVQGLLSGDYPDCMFGRAHAEPLNLAIRGILLDLTQFDDFEEVTKRFRQDAYLPYCYKDGCYALPDTQSFRVQFYRKDIFEELGLSVPETWDDFAAVAAELMRNNMQVGLPYSSLTGPEMMNSGVSSLSLLPTLLLQHDVPLYNEELTACLLNEPAAIEVFTMLTDFYTEKGFPLSANFYNQFRAGLMPLSIQPYTIYTTLDEMAPDIRGRWDIAPLPGVQKENGSVDRTDAASGTGAYIVKRSNNPEAAWKLLKWWTSADTQTRYSQGMENRLGSTGRQPVANVEALTRLSWKADTLKVLENQGENVSEYPELPGGYYMSRAIDQAFWNVTSSGKRPKDMLFKWSEIANREIARKIAEYSAQTGD